MGDAFGDGWFTRSDELPEERLAAREPRPAPWEWTDDSAMAFVLFAHLGAHGEVRPDGLAREFAAEYARDPGRKYGPSMHSVLRRIGEGEDWRTVTTEQFGGQGSFGNGAAMRVAPLGAWFGTDLPGAVEQARLSALTTHAHPEAVAGAVAVAVAAARSRRADEGNKPRSAPSSCARPPRTPRRATYAPGCSSRRTCPPTPRCATPRPCWARESRSRRSTRCRSRCGPPPGTWTT